MRRFLLAALLFFTATFGARAEEAEQLYYTLRSKVLSVKDYVADVRMKVDVSYMKVPLLNGKLYFKSPDKMKLERKGGVSILPKKKVNLTLAAMIPNGQVTVIDAGSETINGKKTRIIKVVPEDDNSGIVLTKMWVDETNMLVVRTQTTMLNEGTVSMSLEYGRYISNSLPDKIIVHLDLKEYKLPKGVTMDYNDVPAVPDKDKSKKGSKNQKGTIEIKYLKYAINTGLSDAIFQDKTNEG